MRTHYITILDANYLARALCLYRSFTPHLGNKLFGFYCLDEVSAAMLETLGLDRAYIVRHDEFASPELISTKATRSISEYCWTCKPAILLHALKAGLNVDWAVYVDSDMMVFGDPDQALKVGDNVDTVITPHRYFAPKFGHYAETAGGHNAGYAAFRNTDRGHCALRWWFDRCLERCSAIPEGQFYADQKYLDTMLSRFSSVMSSPDKGLNAAPWNIEANRTTKRGCRAFIGDDELLIYHFQGLKIYGARLYDLYAGHIKVPRDAARHIYRPYVRSLRQSYEILRFCRPGFSLGIDPFLAKPTRVLTQTKRLMLGINNLAVA